MGCASSKRTEVKVDVYRPSATSFAVFDINAIEEPWVKADVEEEEQPEKTSQVPEQLLLKFNANIDDAPRSWDEVSKDLENLKPTLHSPKPPTLNPNPKPQPKPEPTAQDSVGPTKRVPRKSFSFHTLEELETRISTKPTMKKTESMNELNKLDSVKPESKKFELKRTESRTGVAPIVESRALVVRGAEPEGYKPVKENLFIVKDRLERQKEGKEALFVKRDPLSDYPDMCPPGGYDAVVLYTTSLGGVRRTFEDCNRVRSILELHRVVFDERDISMHGKFLHELKDMLGEGVSVPRIFVKGKYVGGVDEVVNLNETSRLGKVLSWARVERGVGRLGCVGCGGARFVPCMDCGGSCKVVIGDKKEKCEKCNENGLVHCPTCA